MFDDQWKPRFNDKVGVDALKFLQEVVATGPAALRAPPESHVRPGAPPEERARERGRVYGTPSYASPEQANLRPLEERSDLYAPGVVMCEVATGSRPYRGARLQQELEELP